MFDQRKDALEGKKGEYKNQYFWESSTTSVVLYSKKRNPKNQRSESERLNCGY